MHAIVPEVDIEKTYRKANYIFLAPFALLMLGFLGEGGWIWGASVMLPCGIVGLLFAKRGLVMAVQNVDLEKQHAGHANVFVGAVLIGLGVLAALLVSIYLTTD